MQMRNKEINKACESMEILIQILNTSGSCMDEVFTRNAPEISTKCVETALKAQAVKHFFNPHQLAIFNEFLSKTSIFESRYVNILLAEVSNSKSRPPAPIDLTDEDSEMEQFIKEAKISRQEFQNLTGQRKVQNKITIPASLTPRRPSLRQQEAMELKLALSATSSNMPTPTLHAAAPKITGKKRPAPQQASDLKQPAKKAKESSSSDATFSQLATAHNAQIEAFLRCPITREVMQNPVMLMESEVVYDQRNLHEWLSKNKRCYVTGRDLITFEIGECSPVIHKLLAIYHKTAATIAAIMQPTAADGINPSASHALSHSSNSSTIPKDIMDEKPDAVAGSVDVKDYNFKINFSTHGFNKVYPVRFVNGFLKDGTICISSYQLAMSDLLVALSDGIISPNKSLKYYQGILPKELRYKRSKPIPFSFAKKDGHIESKGQQLIPLSAYDTYQLIKFIVTSSRKMTITATKDKAISMLCALMQKKDDAKPVDTAENYFEAILNNYKPEWRTDLATCQEIELKPKNLHCLTVVKSKISVESQSVDTSAESSAQRLPALVANSMFHPGAGESQLMTRSAVEAKPFVPR